MSDPDPAEERPAVDGPQPAAETALLDRLIAWAIAQGDAAVEELHAYLIERGLREPAPLPARLPQAGAESGMLVATPPDPG
jgi:hypothetical protein